MPVIIVGKVTKSFSILLFIGGRLVSKLERHLVAENY